jgi:hypothetical protein
MPVPQIKSDCYMGDRVPIIIEIIKLAVMPTAKLTNNKGRMITPSLYLYD